MTLQEFAKENYDFWQWIAEGKKFRFWDDNKNNSIIGYIGGIDFCDQNTEYHFLREGITWYKNCELIKPVKKPVSFAEAIKFFEDKQNGWYYEKSTYIHAVYCDVNFYEIKNICDGGNNIPEWFPCEEVEE